MSFKKTLLVGLGIAVGAVSLDNYISGNVYAAGDKTEQKQEEVKKEQKSLEEKALFGDKEPDESLTKLINSLDYKKIDEQINKGTTKYNPEWENIIKGYKGILDEIRKYNLDSLSKEQKKDLALAFGSLSSSLYGKKMWKDAVIYDNMTVQLEPTNITYWYNRGLSYIEYGISTENVGFLLESKRSFQEILELVDEKSEMYKKAKRIIKNIDEKYIPTVSGKKEAVN